MANLTDAEQEQAIRNGIERSKEALDVRDIDLRRQALQLACGTNIPGFNGVACEDADTLLAAAHKFFAFMRGEEETPDAPKLKAVG